jgi:hypothetical protein
MKTTAYAFILAGTLLFGSNFDIGVSGSDGKIDGFSLSIGDYYRVPQQEVVVVERRIPREEVGVAYYLARHAHRDVGYITDLRLHGQSWWDITLRLGLDPRTIYVVNTAHSYGPPYGKAYGYQKKHRLHDREIVDLVNVRFLSDYHHITPDEVIKRRRGGDHYDRIDRHYRDNRKEMREDRRDHKEDRKESREDRGEGNKGHGNPHDR